MRGGLCSSHGSIAGVTALALAVCTGACGPTSASVTLGPPPAPGDAGAPDAEHLDATTAAAVKLGITPSPIQVERGSSASFHVAAVFSDRSSRDVTTDPTTHYIAPTGTIAFSVMPGLVTGLRIGSGTLEVEYQAARGTAPVIITAFPTDVTQLEIIPNPIDVPSTGRALFRVLGHSVTARCETSRPTPLSSGRSIRPPWSRWMPRTTSPAKSPRAELR
jgi:hypothetical protein